MPERTNGAVSKTAVPSRVPEVRILLPPPDIYNMDKETFHKKWYYRLLQVLFWGTLIPVSGTLIIVAILGIFGIGEDDIPIAGLFWASILIIIYWSAKKIFYYIMFKEKIL